MYERVNGRESAKDWNVRTAYIEGRISLSPTFENVVDRDKRSTKNS